MEPATVALCDAELSGHAALAAHLRARIPVGWPPPVFEADDIQRVRAQLTIDPDTPWTLYYLLLEATSRDVSPDLVGIAGFVSAPGDGEVEIGYAVMPEYQRRGLAT